MRVGQAGIFRRTSDSFRVRQENDHFARSWRGLNQTKMRPDYSKTQVKRLRFN
jgi:hypothetical protein